MPRHSNMFLNTTDGGLLRIPFWLELLLPPFHPSLVFLGSALGNGARCGLSECRAGYTFSSTSPKS